MLAVLGGGVAGLIWAWAFARGRCTLVAGRLGGAMLSPLPVGPRYLHVSDAARAFLDSLGFRPGSVRTVSCVVCPAAPYSLKTRGVDVSAADTMLVTSHDVFDAPTLRDVTARLVDCLRGRVDVLCADAVRVRDGVVALSSGESVPYEQLVNTLPFPRFVEILDREFRPEALGGAYLSIPVRFDYWRLQAGAWPWEPHDYIYVGDLSAPFSRVARVEGEGGVAFACVEYPGLDSVSPAPPAAPHGLPASCSLEASTLLPMGRVISRALAPQAAAWFACRGITHFGRFAEWQDWVLTHHLIERVAGGRV